MVLEQKDKSLAQLIHLQISQKLINNFINLRAIIINYVQYREFLLFVHTFNNKFVKNIIKLLLLPYLF